MSAGLLALVLQLCFEHTSTRVQHGFGHPRLGQWFDSYIAMRQYSLMAINDSSLDRLNKAFSALADPTRRAILTQLVAGEASVSELVRPFRLAQPTISKHLKVLEEAGLVARGRDAQRRPRQLVSVQLKEIADWIEPFRRQWEARFSNLDNYLVTMSVREKQRGGRNNNKK
jgi:DNA-binding transcriptional ArsR family regulator